MPTTEDEDPELYLCQSRYEFEGELWKCRIHRGHTTWTTDTHITDTPSGILTWSDADAVEPSATPAKAIQL